MKSFLRQVLASTVAIVALFVLVVGGDAAAAAVGGWGGGLSQAVADTLYCNLTATSCTFTGTTHTFGGQINLRNAANLKINAGTAGTASFVVGETVATGDTQIVLAGTTHISSTAITNVEGPLGLKEVTGTAPAAPYACSVTYQHAIIGVDDTNDGAASFLCFCGKGADDSTYSWQKVSAPGTSCGPF